MNTPRAQDLQRFFFEAYEEGEWFGGRGRKSFSGRDSRSYNNESFGDFSFFWGNEEMRGPSGRSLGSHRYHGGLI